MRTFISRDTRYAVLEATDMYMCIFIYMYIHTCIHTGIHIYMDAYMYTIHINDIRICI